MATFEESIQENDDLSDLRKLRGTKKSCVTRANTYIQSITTSLDDLDICELQRRYDNLLTAVYQYETVAKRIAELEGRDFYVEDETDSQLAEIRHIQKLYLDKLFTYEILGKGKYIISKLEQILARSKISGAKTKADLSEQETKIEDLREDMVYMPSIEELKSLDYKFDEVLERISIRIDEECVDDGSSISSPPTTTTSTSSISPPRRTTHLKLALPKFSGQIIDWHKFWGIYEGRLERETALSDLEKISCLEEAMQSDEAKDIVRQASQSRNYAKVVEALKREFDQPRLIFNHHLTKMLAMKSVKDDNKSLSEFLRTIEGHIEGLLVTKGFTAEQLVCGILSPLMAGLSKQEWKSHIASTHHPPTLEQLTDFIIKRKDATRDDRPVEDANSTIPTSQNKTKLPYKEKKQHERVLHVQEAKLPTCNYCQQGHYTFKCPTLISQNVDKRNEGVRQKRLCYNCLSSDHRSIVARIASIVVESTIPCCTDQLLLLISTPL